jgi:hypothetical protein
LRTVSWLRSAIEADSARERKHADADVAVTGSLDREKVSTTPPGQWMCARMSL